MSDRIVIVDKKGKPKIISYKGEDKLILDDHFEVLVTEWQKYRNELKRKNPNLTKAELDKLAYEHFTSKNQE
ncbi:MAG: hypothetical protein ACTSWR_00760 [Candidatus Helarchaeota archaeon]